MQDQYAGDIGDYVKIALLNAVGVGRKIGVGWYYTPNETQLNDGVHTTYLEKRHEDAWSSYDPTVYKKLRALVAGEQRTISALERGLIAGAVTYHNELLTGPGIREDWYARLKSSVSDCDLIFVDPDNGIEPAGFRAGSRKSIKSITFDEIKGLYSPTRPIVIYHHQTRFKGGHLAEIEHLGGLLADMDLGSVCAVRARMWSPRVFFIIGTEADTWQAAKDFAERWSPHVTFHPIKGPPLTGDATHAYFSEDVYFSCSPGRG
jgi:hypothetical protein